MKPTNDELAGGHDMTYLTNGEFEVMARAVEHHEALYLRNKTAAMLHMAAYRATGQGMTCRERFADWIIGGRLTSAREAHRLALRIQKIAKEDRAAALDRIEALTAERDKAQRDRDCFKRTTQAHWLALCAMRNSINEYVPMPNTDSGPLFSPEDGPIYADIAERVVTRIADLEAKLSGRKVAYTRVKVKPLVWNGFVAGNYHIEVEKGGIATLWYYFSAMEEPTMIQRGYLTLVSVDDLKATAQTHHEARTLASLEPTPTALTSLKGDKA